MTRSTSCLRIGICIFFLFIFAHSAVFSLPAVVIEEGAVIYPLGPYLKYLEDKSGKWEINDIVSLNNLGRFKPFKQNRTNFGYTNSTYWVHFSIYNPHDESVRILLEHAHPFMNSVQLFYLDEPGKLGHKVTGLHHQIDSRDVFSRHHVFKLNLRPESVTEMYLGFATTGRMNIPLTLWTPDAYDKKMNIEQITLGIF